MSGLSQPCSLLAAAAEVVAVTVALAAAAAQIALAHGWLPKHGLGLAYVVPEELHDVAAQTAAASSELFALARLWSRLWSQILLVSSVDVQSCAWGLELWWAVPASSGGQQHLCLPAHWQPLRLLSYTWTGNHDRYQ